jgi:hypothetical protein
MKIALPKLRMLSNRKQTALDVEEELQFHIDMLECKYTQHGMSASAARAAAVKRFGNLQRVKRQCVDIRKRNSTLRRVLKTTLILIALIGFAISILSSEFRVARIGHVLIVIAIVGRLLLYVRGLIFLPQTKEKSLSVFTDTPEDGSRLA